MGRHVKRMAINQFYSSIEPDPFCQERFFSHSKSRGAQHYADTYISFILIVGKFEHNANVFAVIMKINLSESKLNPIPDPDCLTSSTRLSIKMADVVSRLRKTNYDFHSMICHRNESNQKRSWKIVFSRRQWPEEILDEALRH